MAYGYLIKNNAGQDIIQGGEEAMILWGGYTVNFKPTSSFPNQSQWYFDLGAISLNSDAVVYVSYSNWSNQPEGARIAVGMVQEGGIGSPDRTDRMVLTFAGDWVASHAVTAKVYVFVKASYRPLPSWGMVIWNTANKVAWHTGGEVMNIEYVARHNYKGGFDFGRAYDEPRHWGTYAYGVQRAWYHDQGLGRGDGMQYACDVTEPAIRLSKYNTVPLPTISPYKVRNDRNTKP